MSVCFGWVGTLVSEVWPTQDPIDQLALAGCWLLQELDAAALLELTLALLKNCVVGRPREGDAHYTVQFPRIVRWNDLARVKFFVH